MKPLGKFKLAKLKSEMGIYAFKDMLLGTSSFRKLACYAT
jgi:hypothetical protein